MLRIGGLWHASRCHERLAARQPNALRITMGGRTAGAKREGTRLNYSVRTTLVIRSVELLLRVSFYLRVDSIIDIILNVTCKNSYERCFKT